MENNYIYIYIYIEQAGGESTRLLLKFKGMRMRVIEFLRESSL
jgi:hypothetical protein